MAKLVRSYQGMAPKLGSKVFVDASAVVIGDVEIGQDSSVWPLTVIRGDMHHVRIGERTSVDYKCAPWGRRIVGAFEHHIRTWCNTAREWDR